MSLSDLISGADCGPSNALQQLGKRFGQDRSSQLDRFGNHAPAASSSSSSMRTSNGRAGGPAAQQFQQGIPSSANAAAPFDLAPLRDSLPIRHSPAFDAVYRQSTHSGSSRSGSASPSSFAGLQHHQQAVAAPGAPAWAADFMAAGGAPPLFSAEAQAPSISGQKFGQARQAVAEQHRHMGPTHFHHHHHQGFENGPGMMPQELGFGGFQQQQIMPAYQPQHQQHAPPAAATAHQKTDDSAQWASAFSAFEQSQLASSSAASLDAAEQLARLGIYKAPPQEPLSAMNEQRSQEPIPPADADELAAAAGKLVDTVSHDQSDKFKRSNFLELMRRLRDKQAGIRGTDIVDTPDAGGSTTGTLDKGKGRAIDEDVAQERMQRPESQQEAYRWAQEMATSGASTQMPPSIQSSLGRTLHLPLDTASTVNAATHKNMMPLTPGPTSLQNEMEGRAELADMWAEEDARSEAIEQAKIREAQERLQQEELRRAFVGDAGDVEARQREDLFAQLQLEDEQREIAKARMRALGTEGDPEAEEFARYQRMQTNIPGADQHWSEMEVGDERMSEAGSEQDFVGRRWEGNKGRGVAGAQAAEWAKLQDDWDAWEATASGVSRKEAGPEYNLRPAPRYTFQKDNPYLNSTHHHAQHSNNIPQAFDSLLESEAHVQSDPQDASAWFDLGVKQQENERESLAIAALRRAIDLDPSLRDAWLALAVSYTNENDRSQAFEAIEQWIQSSGQYAEIVRQHRGDGKHDTRGMTALQRHQILTETLIALARHGSSAGEVDADVQIALGVLFNASEEYEKAVDCFASALSVRPDDWLLYNRLGATLSNSGRSSEAIGYYHHALSLQPGFVRCHFNLSISCLNLKLYQDAAEHIFSALSIQASQSAQMQQSQSSSGLEGQAEAGVGSSSLWETFRVALELMERHDLANLCSQRDVSLFDPQQFTKGGAGAGPDANAVA